MVPLPVPQRSLRMAKLPMRSVGTGHLTLRSLSKLPLPLCFQLQGTGNAQSLGTLTLPVLSVGIVLVLLFSLGTVLAPVRSVGTVNLPLRSLRLVNLSV